MKEKRTIKYAEEIAKGKKMRDSDLYRVNNMNINDEKCSLELGLMKWSELHIARYLEQELELLDEKNYPHGIAIASLIETNDAYFIFGER